MVHQVWLLSTAIGVRGGFIKTQMRSDPTSSEKRITSMNGEKILPADYKSGSITVRKVSIADLSALGKILARAFNDDPMSNWICLQDRHRKERIIRSMNLALHLVLPFGQIYTTKDQTGAAAWMPPGKTDFGFGQVLMLLSKGIRVTGIRHGISLLIVGLMIGKRRPKTPHWYLSLIGVEPSFQGKGIGCALLQPILNRCDQDHLPAYLETQKERNVSFYKHRGFEVKERLKLPYGAPDCFCMLREPL
jgi:ribosomal protein S18 acetylase RimI-like enzyme